MLYKLKFSDIQSNYNGDESGAGRIVNLYADVANRRDFLRGLEALCGLPECSLAMYCPPTKMNAKIADVKLLIENRVVTFADYDQDRFQSNLTRGALLSRTQRFAELWSTQIFLRRDVWDALEESSADTDQTSSLAYLQTVVASFLFRPDPTKDPRVLRMSMEASIVKIKDTFPKAARNCTIDFDRESFDRFEFPSGLPFSYPEQ